MTSTFNPLAALFYKDSIDVYRGVFNETLSEDADVNDLLGFVLTYTGIACNVHDTPNYDVHSSPAGMTKENNLLTANKYTCGWEVDVRSLDVVLVTTRYGTQYWQTVEGAPKKSSLLPHTFFYGVPLASPPTIYIPPGLRFQILIPPVIPPVLPPQIPGF